MERKPHTVPRGLLRFYILRLLTQKPMKGYELITEIESRTEGTWKPGPGSIYPMLESLSRENLIQSTPIPKKQIAQRRGTTYQITEKGKDALNDFREELKSRMRPQMKNLLSVFTDLIYPGLKLDEIFLIERRRENERHAHVLEDSYWNAIPAEKKGKFFEAYMKIVDEELDFVKKKMSMIE